MSENVKTYVFPENQGAFGGNGMEGMLLGSMMNGGGGFGGGMNNPFWAFILLAFLRNWGWDGNGNGGNGCGCMTQNQLSQIQETLNTNQGNTLLMNAITQNGSSTKELATALNCNFNAVQAAINAIQSAIAGVGNQMGMGQMQVINAIQAGNTAIANQIATCCCENKQLVQKMGYDNQINNLQQSQMIQNGFCQVGYEAAQNANGIKQAISDQTIAVIGKIDAQESARKDREINALTAQLATVNARAERAAELAPIVKALEEIKGKQPNTVPVQWPQLAVYPTYAFQSGTGYPTGGFWGA